MFCSDIAPDTDDSADEWSPLSIESLPSSSASYLHMSELLTSLHKSTMVRPKRPNLDKTEMAHIIVRKADERDTTPRSVPSGCMWLQFPTERGTTTINERQLFKPNDGQAIHVLISLHSQQEVEKIIGAFNEKNSKKAIKDPTFQKWSQYLYLNLLLRMAQANLTTTDNPNIHDAEKKDCQHYGTFGQVNVVITDSLHAWNIAGKMKLPVATPLVLDQVERDVAFFLDVSLDPQDRAALFDRRLKEVRTQVLCGRDPIGFGLALRSVASLLANDSSYVDALYTEILCYRKRQDKSKTLRVRLPAYLQNIRESTLKEKCGFKDTLGREDYEKFCKILNLFICCINETDSLESLKELRPNQAISQANKLSENKQFTLKESDGWLFYAVGFLVEEAALFGMLAEGTIAYPGAANSFLAKTIERINASRAEVNSKKIDSLSRKLRRIVDKKKLGTSVTSHGLHNQHMQEEKATPQKLAVLRSELRWVEVQPVSLSVASITNQQRDSERATQRILTIGGRTKKNPNGIALTVPSYVVTPTASPEYHGYDDPIVPASVRPQSTPSSSAHPDFGDLLEPLSLGMPALGSKPIRKTTMSAQSLLHTQEHQVCDSCAGLFHQRHSSRPQRQSVTASSLPLLSLLEIEIMRQAVQEKMKQKAYLASCIAQLMQKNVTLSFEIQQMLLQASDLDFDFEQLVQSSSSGRGGHHHQARRFS